MVNVKKVKKIGRKFQVSVLAGLLAVAAIPFVGNTNPSKALAAEPGTPGGTPDYWTTPNYANSPLPELDANGKVVPGTGIRKFVDTLPGLGKANANNLGQYIAVAIPDTTTYPGSDYYEISLVEYKEKMHSDLPETTLRGYEQTNTTDPTVKDKPSYFGPMIIAQKNRPVRIKFTNKLPKGSGGDLFLPVDTSLMGAGMGPDGKSMYTQNRATLHLHGGITPWISDGTPHQWITPAGENTPYPKGVSVKNVPDMPDPGDGSMTFFYTNQQSARLMWVHDHSYGITRLNVYAGEASGYMIQDDVEKDLINRGVLPKDEMPLIIQDKTFVPSDNQLAATDPTWDKAKWGGIGNLWFPHVYMPNQNPYDMSGANPMGRWDYGPWFWPPNTGLKNGPVPNPLAAQQGQAPMNPGVPNVTAVPEAFMDTPVINGTAYPTLTVDPKAYRFKILNASNDRMWNLQFYKAKAQGVDMWKADGSLNNADSGEVKMVPAVTTPGFPGTDPKSPDKRVWPTDGRDGGVPDPAASGPEMIQIGNDSGFLPKPAVLANQPVDYEYGRRSITVLNVSSKTLLLGPAERADVVVDFSKYAGQTLILYNDSPAPVPAFDPRYDYYTGDPDQSATGENTGGAPTTQPGYGPNTRTMMMIKVAGDPTAKPDTTQVTLDKLNVEIPTAFKNGQNSLIYNNEIYGQNDPRNNPKGKWVNIQDNSTTFNVPGTSTTVNMPITPKAIAEEFEQNYGRMNATLGTELPNTNFQNQTTIMLGYLDPSTENMKDSIAPIGQTGDGTQIWKITHNGVDTHAIHFHLFDVQLINRVGWDGSIRMPDDNERGWKDTVRMNPLEDCIIALRPVAPKLPFGLPDSIRPLDPTMPIGTTGQFMNVDPLTGNPVTVTNDMTNYGWEYVWHCHLLGHEENDMMRPYHFTINTIKPSPSVLNGTRTNGGPVTLSWTDPTPVDYKNNANYGNSANEIGYNIMRAIVTNGKVGSFTQIGVAMANATGFTDPNTNANTTYQYRVDAFNAATAPNSTDPVKALQGGTPSNVLTLAGTQPVQPPAAPSNLQAQVQSGPSVSLTWKDNATNETGFVLERSSDNGATYSEIATPPSKNNTGYTSYTDTNVVAGTKYVYRVKAVNGSTSSNYSNTTSATIPAPAAPAAPMGVIGFPSHPRNSATDTLTVYWNKPPGTVTGYVVQIATDQAFTQNVSTVNETKTSTIINSLTRGKTYYFRVQAVNQYGTSPWSSSSRAPMP
jgi:FtsP/CotA-like multicopper oxidase with cupredoxin domain